jgi:uncharacterized cupin superfamily protein
MARVLINLDDLEFIDLAQMSAQQSSELPKERYGGRMAPVGRMLGAQKLGYNVTVIAPGKRAFPFHSHRANEEMFFILEGRGELRFGDQRHPLRQGDFVACPTGGPDVAHQIVNTGDAELKVLAVSTALSPDVCHYPDTHKFGVLDGFGPGGFRHIGREGEGLDYWEGE